MAAPKKQTEDLTLSQTQAQLEAAMSLTDEQNEFLDRYWPGNLTAGLVFLEHRLGARDGHGETDPDTALRPVNRRVDADHAAVRIGQRTAAIARIDGRISLDHAVEFALFGLNGAVERTDDPGGQRPFKLERVADGEHLLPHDKTVAIAESQGGQFACGVDFDKR